MGSVAAATGAAEGGARRVGAIASCQSLDIKRRAIGGDNPDYAASLHALAGVLAAQGQVTDALSIADQAVAILTRVGDSS